MESVLEIRHPFMAQFFELFEDAFAFYVVMESAEHGPVIDLVERNGVLLEQRAREYFCELIFVLDHLHSAKMIAHRDLKAENVLFDRHDHIRLVDFGPRGDIKDALPITAVCGPRSPEGPGVHARGGRLEREGLLVCDNDRQFAVAELHAARSG
jgi:serine/threonine protein kinase